MLRWLLAVQLLLLGHIAVAAIGMTTVPVSIAPTSLPFAGWNTFYGNTSMDTTTIETIADWLHVNMPGYNVVWVDEGWAASRTGGHLVPVAGIPDITALATHIKANGQIPGIYSDGGSTLCNTQALGSAGHFLTDFTDFFVNWGYQLLKLDGCGVGGDGLDPKAVGENAESVIAGLGVSGLLYGPAFGSSDATITVAWEWGPYNNATSMSLFGSDPGGIGCHATGFDNLVGPTRAASFHPGAFSPGLYDGSFYLLGGSADLNSDEVTTQFALTAAISQSPRIIACDPRNLTVGQKALYQNADIIAQNQDPWILHGFKVGGANGSGGYTTPGTYEVFAKWNSVSGQRVIALVNETAIGADGPETMVFDPSTIGITGTYDLRDLVAGTTRCTGCSGTITSAAKASHGTDLLLLSNGTETKITCSATNPGGSSATATGEPGACAFTADNWGWPGLFGGGFSADSSTTTTTGSAIATTGVTNPAPQSVYQSARYCTAQKTGTIGECPFDYFANNLVIGATYKIRLHFAEIAGAASGARKFNVRVLNGVTNTLWLSDFDINATAGGLLKATVQETTVTAPHGQLSIVFSSGSAGFALVNGIEIIKQ